VNLFPQAMHSFRLRVVLSGESRVSKVLKSADPQYGHFMPSLMSPR
jgi:hypothetical protein